MKRMMMVVLCVMMLGNVPINASELNLSVTVNGTYLLFDSEPFISGGRTMVPIRIIADVFGAEEVSWNAEEESVTILYEGYEYRMTIGSPTYLMGGIPREMDAVPVIVEGRTMLPLRYVAETFGFEVLWDESTRTVALLKDGVVVPEDYIGHPAYTNEDVLWLARIINVEGLDIGYEAKLAIGNVVLNRVKGDEYPDTVYDVIMDSAYTVQFPPAHRDSFQILEPDDQSWQVAIDALNGANNIGDCLYFNNQPFKWKSDDLYKVIEGEYFYH